MEQGVGTIGQSVVIKGNLTAKEDLTVEGQVDGKVELDASVLTVGANGRLKGQVLARTVIVMGKATGNITATETIRVRKTATVEGDLTAPKMGIEEGATVQGRIDMQAPGTRKVHKDQSKQTKAPPQSVAAGVR